VQAVSQLLFDPRASADTLHSLDAKTLGQVAEEIPSPEVSKSIVVNHLSLLDLLSEHTGILPSRSEAKKAIQNNAISVNKQKISTIDAMVTPEDILHDRYIMVENGKKNKYLVKIV
jgi:tyrosyl-tRNA synthetase